MLMVRKIYVQRENEKCHTFFFLSLSAIKLFALHPSHYLLFTPLSPCHNYTLSYPHPVTTTTSHNPSLKTSLPLHPVIPAHLTTATPCHPHPCHSHTLSSTHLSPTHTLTFTPCNPRTLSLPHPLTHAPCLPHLNIIISTAVLLISLI